MARNKKNGNVIDLDDLFGQGDAVIIKFGGKEYPMCRPIDLDPRQLQQFQKLSARVAKLQQIDDDAEFSDEDADYVEETINDILLMVSPKMPVDKMPFMAKVYVLNIYKQEISEVDDEAKKESEADQSTGA